MRHANEVIQGLASNDGFFTFSLSAIVKIILSKEIFYEIKANRSPLMSLFMSKTIVFTTSFTPM